MGQPSRGLPSGFASVRDALSFLVGSGILVYSIVVAPPPPEALSIGAGVALIGLPATSLIGARNGGKSPQE